MFGLFMHCCNATCFMNYGRINYAMAYPTNQKPRVQSLQDNNPQLLKSLTTINAVCLYNRTFVLLFTLYFTIYCTVYFVHLYILHLGVMSKHSIVLNLKCCSSISQISGSLSFLQYMIWKLITL